MRSAHNRSERHTPFTRMFPRARSKRPASSPQPPFVGRSSMTRRFLLLLGVLPLAIAAAPAFAPDESVYVKNLKAGERESILYVWTRDGDGKDSDFLSVVDVDPKSASYGK